MKMTEQLEISINNRKKNTSKLKLMKCLRLLFYVLCVRALSYQLVTLVVQYMQYKTVVNIDIETVKYHGLPSITICYPYYLSMKKAAEKYPIVRPTFDKYKDLLKNVSNDDYYNRTFQEELNSIYYKIKSNLDLNVAKDYDLMFDNKFESGSSLFLGNYTHYGIELTTNGLRRYENGTVEDFSIKDTDPIQSKISSK